MKKITLNKQTVNEMVSILRDHYDYILKYDSLVFLKENYFGSNKTIRNMLDAHAIAYD